MLIFFGACGHLGATSGERQLNEVEYVTTTVGRFCADSVLGPVEGKVMNVLQILSDLYFVSNVMSG
jgi:hypothetical protein